MEDKQSNVEIAERLRQETDDVTGQSEQIWANIDQQLFADRQVVKRPRRRRRLLSIGVMAALIAIVWIGLTSTLGQAVIQNIKDMFVEEKDVELHIEGEKEGIHVELEVNEQAEYIIYVDTDRYKLESGETYDLIVPKEPLEDRYPEVAMKIEWREETKEVAIASVKEEIAALDMDLRREEELTEPFASSRISAIGKGEETESGDQVVQWDTPVYQYDIIQVTDEQVFLVKQMYFLEAAEGHGVRFDAMLESFEIVK